MAKYLSEKVRSLQVGLTGHSESKIPLNVIGSAVIAGITTIGPSGIQASGISTFGEIRLGAGITLGGSSGIISATKFYGDGSGLIGVATAVDGVVIGTGISISGISTIGKDFIVTPTSVGIGATVGGQSGIVTYYGDGSNLTGIATAVDGVIVGTGLSISGLSTISSNATIANVILTKNTTGLGATIGSSGIITYYGDGSNLTGIATAVDGVIVGTALSVAGISTLGALTVDSIGIVTSAIEGGIVTYYGDGQYLENLTTSENIVGSALSISGITTIGFTTVTNDLYVSGVATFINGDFDILKAGSNVQLISNATGYLSILNENSEGSIQVGGAADNPAIEIDSGSISTVTINHDGNQIFKSSSIGPIFAKGLHVTSGIASVGSAITMYSTTGIVSATKFYGDGSNLSGVEATDVGSLDNLNVTGLSTIANVKFVTEGDTVGIVTSAHSSGIVTYYGDGRYLDGVASSDMILVGTGLSVIGIATLGITTVSETLYVSGISTFNDDVAIGGTVSIGGTVTIDGPVGFGSTVTVGTAITMYYDTGIISATSYRGKIWIDEALNDNYDLQIPFLDSVSGAGDDGNAYRGLKVDTGELYYNPNEKTLKVDKLQSGDESSPEFNKGIYVSSGIATFEGGIELGDNVSFTSDQVTTTNLKTTGVSTLGGNVYIGSGHTVGFGSTAFFPNDAAIEFNDFSISNIGNLGPQIALTNNKALYFNDGNPINTYASINSGGLLVSGVTTVGTGNKKVTINGATGIITSGVTAGVVTYYGDGSNLSGVAAEIAVQDEGSEVGTAATTFNFTGGGVVATYNNGVAEIAVAANTDSLWVTTDAGIHTSTNVGLGTTNPRTQFQIRDTYGLESGIGTWMGVAGVAHTINEYNVTADNFRTAEYTLFVQKGSDAQTQKVLGFHQSGTGYSQEYAIAYSNELLVSAEMSIDSNVMKLELTPETGINGLISYKFARNTLL